MPDLQRAAAGHHARAGDGCGAGGLRARRNPHRHRRADRRRRPALLPCARPAVHHGLSLQISRIHQCANRTAGVLAIRQAAPLPCAVERGHGAVAERAGRAGGARLPAAPLVVARRRYRRLQARAEELSRSSRPETAGLHVCRARHHRQEHPGLPRPRAARQQGGRRQRPGPRRADQALSRRAVPDRRRRRGAGAAISTCPTSSSSPA